MVERTDRRTVLPREIVIEKLGQIINEIKKQIPVDRVYLYGSYANGSPKPYSDVDVTVISPTFGHDLIKETVFLMELFEKTGLMVEPRAYSRDEFLKAEPGTFLHDEVIRKGYRLL